MLVVFLAWGLIGLGLLIGVPAVVRLQAGRSGARELTAGAHTKAWREVLSSVATAGGGVSFLVKSLGSNGYYRLGVLVLSVVLVVPTLWRTADDDDDDDDDDDVAPPRESLGPELPVPPVGASGRQLADWVERKRFATTRLRFGYDEEEVDALLDKIRDTFLGTALVRVTRQELRSAHFTETHLRPGYTKQDVDAFLVDAGTRLT